MAGSRHHIAPAPDAGLRRGATPSFSVIIAAYQAAATISAAVESAVRQTSPPLEIIICDDGSTDNLDGALAGFGERVTLLRRSHNGAAAARNAAVAAASGDFAAILDADDVYLPERLEALGELAALRPDLDILATDAYLESAGREVGRFNDGRHPFAAEGQREAILQRNFILGNAAVRRKRLLAIGGFDESLECAEDWEGWIRLILAGAKAGSVDQPLARYRLRAGSLASDRTRALRCRVSALEKVRTEQLIPRERQLLRTSLRAHRIRADLAEAEAALAAKSPDARRRLAAVARDRDFGLPTRAKAALGALAPGLVGRLAARRARADAPRLVRPGS